MTDVQNQPDNRGIKIQKTGVNNVHLPFFISDCDDVQQVTAQIRFTVTLAENFRGTHMSRFSEILTAWTTRPIKIPDVEKILLDALEKLSTDFAAINLAFKFFLKKFSPVTKKISLSPVDCEFIGELNRSERMKFTLGLVVPYMSLCPCSKEISDFGAHNQRSICRVKLTFKDFENISIKNFVHLIETQGS